MKIMESAENYLETILVLSNKGDKVRSIDIVTETGYTKPSISRAVKSLKESGYISVDVHGYIDLLPSGRAIAEKIYERHRFLSKYLMKIGVSEETALTDACRIEHVISEESFDKLKEFVMNFRTKFLEVNLQMNRDRGALISAIIGNMSEILKQTLLP